MKFRFTSLLPFHVLNSLLIISCNRKKTVTKKKKRWQNSIAYENPEIAAKITDIMKHAHKPSAVFNFEIEKTIPHEISPLLFCFTYSCFLRL